MKYYLAPLEGVTSYIYRNAYHRHFYPMDKYFTPFITAHPDKRFSTREKKELSPENNQGLFVVPQILANRASDFLKTAADVRAMGYEEVNLNLGCPSGTVVAKKKGSGFLAYPDELREFLNEIYEKSDMKISIKTRIGKEDAAEFERILAIYNEFPVYELIIHPRVQTDFYRNTPNIDAYRFACRESLAPLCYNGDINDRFSYDRLLSEFPDIDAVMCGRGVIANPGLIGELAMRQKMSMESFRSFHNEIYQEYREVSNGDRNVLFKMKELWSYMGRLFPEDSKLLKKLKKAEKLVVYEDVVNQLFAEGKFVI